MTETNLDSKLQEIFNIVCERIVPAISNNELNPDSFQTILSKIVETVEEHYGKTIPGTEKRAIATNLAKLVIDKLHEKNQINDETYQWLSMGLTFIAPVVFSGLKALYDKTHEVIQDIQEFGSSGCCKRNFCKPKK